MFLHKVFYHQRPTKQLNFCIMEMASIYQHERSFKRQKIICDFYTEEYEEMEEIYAKYFMPSLLVSVDGAEEIMFDGGKWRSGIDFENIRRGIFFPSVNYHIMWDYKMDKLCFYRLSSIIESTIKAYL